ncbi:MAG: NusG domain II-containing protein [Clostridia bacterium]|nr:NusG domain II-containing protein [Clostridia bacterium]
MTKKIRNDVILIAAILLVAILSFLIFKSSLKNGENAVITVEGETVAVLTLSEDTTKTIETKYGINEVTIMDKTVFVSNADCPDKICVEHREISRVGETIVCLPHKLVVEISEVVPE